MPVSCQPNDLAQAAKCFECIPTGMQAAVQTYLLAQINGGETDPQKLLTAAQAAGYQKLRGSEAEVQNYLLCQIVNK